MRKLVIGALIAVALSITAFGMQAEALNSGRAESIAIQKQRSTCGDFWHVCQDALYTWPYCRGPYRGHVQWWCTGSQERYYWPAYRDEIWQQTVGISAYGHIVRWWHNRVA